MYFINSGISQNKEKNNLIDNLTTTKEVVEFAKSIYPDFNGSNHGNLVIKSTDTIIKDISNCKLYESWGIKNWEKIDLNNDKKTDLLFTGFWYSNFSQYVIMSEEKKYSFFIISDNIEYGCKILKPIIVNKKKQLLINNFKTNLEEETVHYMDTITYKFNSFVELNDKIANYNIEKIKFTVDYNFEIEIDNKGNAYYKCLDEFNITHLKGNFYKGNSNKIISLSSFNELKELLNYIRVKELSDQYSINGYDFTSTRLKVTFEDGSIKEINDYGFQGTFGLKAAYEKLTQLAREINWR